MNTAGSPPAHFYGLLQHQRPRLHERCETPTFDARVRNRHLLRPTILSFYRLVFYRRSVPTASPANSLCSLFPLSCLTQPFKTAHRVLPDHRSLTASLPNLPQTQRRCCLAPRALQHALIRPPAVFHWVFTPLHRPGLKLNLRRAYLTPSRSIE